MLAIFYNSYKWRACVLACVSASLLQLCPTLCDPMDHGLPGSSVHGILQARTLEWVAIFFSNKWRITFKNCKSPYCTPIIYNIVYQQYFNFLKKKKVQKGNMHLLW